MSFVERGDPYPEHVRASVRAVIEELGWEGSMQIAWQSKVGRGRWLSPSTEQAIEALGATGTPRVLVVPLAFVGEHIETLYEIDIEYRDLARERGIGAFGRARALGLHPAFIDVLAELARGGLEHFGSSRCVRCLLPEPDYYGRGKACPNCRFEWPTYLARSTALVRR